MIRVAALQSRIARDLRQHSRLTHDARKHKPAGERSVMKLVAKEKSKLAKSISKALQDLRIWLSANGELPPALAVTPQQCNDVGALLKSGVCPWQCVPSLSLAPLQSPILTLAGRHNSDGEHERMIALRDELLLDVAREGEELQRLREDISSMRTVYEYVRSRLRSLLHVLMLLRRWTQEKLNTAIRQICDSHSATFREAAMNAGLVSLLNGRLARVRRLLDDSQLVAGVLGLPGPAALKGDAEEVLSMLASVAIGEVDDDAAESEGEDEAMVLAEAVEDAEAEAAEAEGE